MQNTLDQIIDVLPSGQFLSSNSSTTNNSLRSLPLSKNRKMVTKSAPQPRTTHQHNDTQGTNVVKLGNRNYRKVEMLPRNTAQETYVEALLEKRMVFPQGPVHVHSARLRKDFDQ